jgi:integrase
LKGTVRKRGNSWVAIVTVGTKLNQNNKLIPEQKWITCRTQKEAEAKVAELVNKVNRNEYIPDSKMTTKEWLQKWLDVYVMKSSKKKLRTKDTYKTIVEKHLIPNLGHIKLQKLSPTHIQEYYNSSSLCHRTTSVHQAVLYQALNVAKIQEKLITENPAELVAEKPNGKKGVAEMQTWSREEANKYLSIARVQGIRTECFYTLALETGMRKGELCGLKWEDINTEEDIISVRRTLLYSGIEAILGTPKNGKCRAIAISSRLVDLLKKLKIEQNKLKLQQGIKFNDLGFVFTKKNGRPLQINNLAENEFNKLIVKAQVKKIRFHDLRHTAATLMLEEGIHFKVVSERLGHSDVSITLNRYSHVTAKLQKEAAQVMGNLLSGH